MKTCKNLKDFVKLCQFFLGLLYYFAFKSTHFAQVLENFSQMCVSTSATFRSSAKNQTNFKESLVLIPKLNFQVTKSWIKQVSSCIIKITYVIKTISSHAFFQIFLGSIVWILLLRFKYSVNVI